MYPAKMSLLPVHCIRRIPVYSKKEFNKKMPKLSYIVLKEVILQLFIAECKSSFLISPSGTQG